MLTAARGTAAADVPGVTVHAVDDPLASEQPFADYDPRMKAPAWKAIARHFVFPDRFVRWRKAAVAFANDLIQSVRFDAVLATFPPASAVQLALQIETDAKLVLDYRDLWIGPGGYEPGTEFVRKKHEKLEREAVARAMRIIAVSDAMADAIAAEQGIERERVVVIPNGYEIIPREAGLIAAPAGAANGAIKSEDRPMTIAHVGTVIARNRPEVFLEALQSVVDRPGADGVTWRFVGNLSRDYLESLGLSGCVQSTGLLPRDAAIREMQAADALLLLTGEYVGRWGASAKLFEYLQTGLPILCLEETAGSNDRAILERFVPDRAFFAPIGDGARILEQVDRIREYRAARPSAALELDPSFRDFSRANLGTKLAAELDSIVVANSVRA